MTIPINKIARIGGLFYLIIIAAGIYGEIIVRSRLIVEEDVAATAHAIMAHQLLWRSGIAADLVMHICDIPLMVIFYVLLKPVAKNLALVALLFNAVQTAVLVANKMNLVYALFPISSTSGLHAFTSEQLYALTNFAIHLHTYGFSVGLLFFGCACIVLGYLIRKSVYLPWLLGILMQIAGVCYLANSFLTIMNPVLADKLVPLILLPPVIAELSLCLWLIFKGVKSDTWNRRATQKAADLTMI